MSIKIGKFVIKPELNEPKYYIHLLGISIVVLGLLQLFGKGNMFNLYNVVIGAILIGIADIINHTILGLD